MAKNKISDYDGVTAGNNTDIGGISIDEGMLPSAVNNSLRELTKQLGAFADGTDGIDVLTLHDDDASASIKFQAPATVTTTTTFTLPDGDGTSGYALVTNGSGTLSWASAGGLSNIVEDTTPQLGGTLDANGNTIDMGVNIITDTKVGQWDTAYGWGDHSTQNYAVTTGDTFTGDVSFGDNVKATFGDAVGGDLQIYHDANHSRIVDSGIGNLHIQADDLRLQTADGTGNYITADNGGEATLYHNGSAKLATASTGVSIPAGQSYAIVSDTDVAINRPTTNTLGIKTGNTQRMRIANGGDISFYADNGTTQGFFWDASTQRLGIGTTSPSSKLHVNHVNTLVSSADIYQTAVNIDNTDTGGRQWGLHSTGSSNGAGRFRIYDYDANVERMTIDTSGNVGIGTDSPSGAQLHINRSGATGSYIRFQDTSGDAYVGTDSGNLQFFSGGANERMRLDNSGRLGLGTSAPDFGLTVEKDNGNGYIASFRKSNSDPFLTAVTTGSITCLQGITSNGASYANTAINPLGGSVGIGTASPNAPLEVVGGATTMRLHRDNASGGGGIDFYNNTQQVANINAGSGTLTFKADPTNGAAGSYVSFETDGSEKARLDASGRLGLGTTAPSYLIHVDGPDLSNLIVAENATGVKTGIGHGTNDGRLGNITNHGLVFMVNDTEFMRIKTSGDVTCKSEGGVANRVDLRQGSGKHWINLNATTASTADSYNVTSIADNGVGRFTVTINNDYNNAHWSSQVNGGYNGSVRVIYGNFEDDQYTGTVKIAAYLESPTGYVDPVDFMNGGHGDLA